MAKGIKDQVETDLAKALEQRRAKKLKEDYERYIGMAARPQQKKEEV